MSTTNLRTALALAIGTGLALTAPGAAMAQSENVCVAYRDIESIRMVDDKTAIVSTRRDDDYLVTFRASCQVRMHAGYFILDRFRLGQCLDEGDVLNASEPIGSCMIASVSLAQDVAIRSDEE